MDNLVLLKGGLFIALGIFFLLLFSYLFYLIFKKYKKPKIGKISGIFVFIFLSFTIGILIRGFPFLFFENYLFFKKDVHQALGKLNLVLSDDFKILDNNISSFTSYIHTFRLEISEKDVNRLIKDNEFDSKKSNRVLIRWEITKDYAKKVVLNIERNTLYYEYIN